MYTYPENYKVKPVAEQWKTLEKVFPALKKYTLPESPENTSEGLFVIPNWRLLAANYPNAVKLVIGKIADSRPFYNYLSNSMDKIRETPQKAKFWDSNAEGIMILPCQFGSKWAGKSVEHVRANKAPNELLLGAYEVALMILTHPERLEKWDELDCDCAGDEFPGADGVFSGYPFLGFRGGRARFGAFGVSFAGGYFGSVSGFVPQPLDPRPADSFDPKNLELPRIFRD